MVREKGLASGELVEACREVRGAVSAGTRVLVAGGRLDAALAAGLAGVHLGDGAGELRVEEVHRLFPEAWVSVSCHSVEGVRRARVAGASGILFAPVFGKWVDGMEEVPGVGLEVLAKACAEAAEIPVFALGGVTAANARECGLVGAAGVAGISMFR